MLDVAEIQKRLRDRNLKQVAKLSGVSYSSLYRLANGDGNQLYKTVKTVSDYLEMNTNG